jgi:peptide/nickel transport system substrate-binding protein
MGKSRFGWAICCIILALGLSGPARADNTLRFALDQDPDALDPAVSGSYGDRIVTNWMCDQLLDVNDKLDYVPDLATSWQWAPDGLSLTLHLRDNVVFQDGEPFTSAAVAANFHRYQTAPRSLRKAEMQPIVAVETPDRLTAKIILSRPYAPLLSLLANRPGTMMSPRILNESEDDIINHPVCSGPYKFVERVAQDHITLERFPGHWNAAAMGPDRVIFYSMIDPTVRLVNLQSGQIDIHNRVAPTDVAAVKADPKLRLLSSPGLGFQLLTFNLANGPQSQTPIGQDPRVREAFEKSIDRKVINEVVFDGGYVPNNQTEPPGSRYWDPALPVPKRDVEGARKLLAQAGLKRVAFSLITGTDAVNAQIGQVIQSMAGEAGFDITLVPEDGSTMVTSARNGNFQATMSIWSGRTDPDGNASIWMACNGFLNWGHHCNPALDRALLEGSSLTDPKARVPAYRRAAEIMAQDRANMVLFHFRYLWGLSARVHGAHAMPDGILRPAGIRLTN